MKTLAVLALGCLVATGAWAQRGGGARGGGFRGGGGGGFRGGGIRGGFGGFHGGFRGGFRGFNRGFGYGFGGYTLPYYSYYPYLGLGYDLGYCSSYVWDYSCGPGYTGYSGYPYSTSPAVTVVQPYQAEPSAPVVVNQIIPAQPQVRAYQPSESPSTYSGTSASSGPPIYLLAFTDHVIIPAYAYWAEGSTLHYLDLDHKQEQAPMARLDRSFSAQLNRERRVPFELP